MNTDTHRTSFDPEVWTDIEGNLLHLMVRHLPHLAESASKVEIWTAKARFPAVFIKKDSFAVTRDEGEIISFSFAGEIRKPKGELLMTLPFGWSKGYCVPVQSDTRIITKVRWR